MKKILTALAVLSISLTVATCQNSNSISDKTQIHATENIFVSPEENINPDVGFMANIWYYITGLITIATVVVRLTPTRKDNDILSLVLKFLDRIVPNKKRGGGKH